jgi:RNA polymerase-interacting CarD/CdnL/TRCF family regulator
MSSFAVGARVVLFAFGPGLVEAVESGAEGSVFVVVDANGQRRRIPEARASLVMRAPITAERAHALLAQLGQPAWPSDDNWKRRLTRYQETVRAASSEGEHVDGGTPEDIANVARELAELGAVKTLSLVERRLALDARTLLAREIALSLDRNEADVLAEIESILKSV